MASSGDGKLELLSVENSALVLVDFQPAMIKGVASGDKLKIKKAAYLAAKAASILGVPVVLSTISPQYNGEFFAEITDLFPGIKPVARKVPSFDAFEDEATWQAAQKTGRQKLVVSGLWTSMCLAYTTIHAVKAGRDTYALLDATGDSTPEAYKYGVKRMLQVGVIPITLESLVSEWMHDWGNPKSGELVKEVYSKYGAMIGVK